MRFILNSIIMCALLAAPAVSMAQQQTWRCPGNYYTNDAAEVQRLGGCTPVGQVITVVPAPPAQSARPSVSETPSEQGGQEPQNDPNAGQRQQLQARLDQLQQELAQLEAEYNNGEPQRMGPEFRNYQMYLDRVERLRREIAAKNGAIEEIRAQMQSL